MTKFNPQMYPAEVFWSDDDEGFIAVAHDLPGCSAWGENESEAITELRQAIEAWFEAATAAGNPIPAPSTPASVEQFSGKLLLRMPKSLHAELDRQAKSEGSSLNSYVVYLLTKRNTQAVTVERMEYVHRLKQIASARTAIKQKIIGTDLVQLYRTDIGAVSTFDVPTAAITTWPPARRYSTQEYFGSN